MTEPEFSAEKFRRFLENKKERLPDPFPYPSFYWSLYYEESSPVYSLNERGILAMSDEEILGAYARWRIES